jgi:hypothetical protein
MILPEQTNISFIVSYIKACKKTQDKNIHIYHSRFIPEGVAEASQIFLRDAYVLPKAMRTITDVTGGKPITV